MTDHRIDRRKFLGASFGAGAALLAGPALFGQASSASSAEPASDGFRFIHLTDAHVQKRLGADRGLAKAFEAANSVSPKPDFIATGGDQVFDAMKQKEDYSRELFGLFNSVRQDHNDLPIYHTIGNHDIFGWAGMYGTTPEHPSYGKLMAQELLDMERTYYAFDHKGWRIYVLDNVQPGPNRFYQGDLDPAQREWLAADLAAKPASTPAVVITHIPILSVTIYSERFFNEDSLTYEITNGLVMRRGVEVARQLAQYNVKLALSGHLHQRDRIEYQGVTFICGGAVSGNWWKGPLYGVEEGFGVVDLKADGAFEYTYHDYGWESEAAGAQG